MCNNFFNIIDWKLNLKKQLKYTIDDWKQQSVTTARKIIRVAFRRNMFGFKIVRFIIYYMEWIIWKRKKKCWVSRWIPSPWMWKEWKKFTISKFSEKKRKIFQFENYTRMIHLRETNLWLSKEWIIVKMNQPLLIR